jgi:hypothetical protein
MYEMIAWCGLDCARCPAYLASRADDMERLSAVAQRWSEDFGMEIRAEQILCEGCKSGTGRKNDFCAVCAVSKCARDKGVETCAHCDDYACDILVTCPGYLAEGKVGLERIRRDL